MQLSETTLKVMKNFASINPNIVIREGNILVTIAESGAILSTAKVDDRFDTEFGVYDLNEFLTTISMCETPEIDFGEKMATIRDTSGRSKIKYYFTDEFMLTSPSEKIMEGASKKDDWVVKLTLDETTLGRIKKTANVLSLDSIAVTGEGGVITMTCFDGEGSSNNTFAIDVPGEYIPCGPSQPKDDDSFRFVMPIANLVIISGEYEASFAEGVSKFESKELDLIYWLALKKD